MDLTLNRLAHVRYTRTTDISGCKGEVTDRVILPTYIPGDSIKALDVSSVPELEALKLQSDHDDYLEYVQNKMSTIFSFEDWLSHTKGKNVHDLKYRTFKVDSINVIKSE